MPERDSALRALLLCCCGFAYKFTATFAVLIGFSSFLKIAGSSGLPTYYIVLSTVSLVMGAFLILGRTGRAVSTRVSFWLNPILALAMAYCGMNYAALEYGPILALYVAVSVYDIYFGILFWNHANSLLTIREMRHRLGLLSAVSFAGGVVAGFLFPLVFRHISFASTYLVCALMFLLMPVFVAMLPRDNEGETHDVKTSQRLPEFLHAILRHPLSSIVVGAMVILAFSRYSIAYIYATALSAQLSDETSLASFTGAYDSSLKLITALVQALLLPVLLRRFGPAKLLGLTPVLLAIGIVAIYLSPVFFVIAGCNFLLLLSIRSLDLNLINLFFNLYGRELRNRFRFAAEGIVFSLTVILTGFFIRYLDASAGRQTLLLLLFISALAYFYIAWRSRKAYQLAVRQNLGCSGSSGVVAGNFEAVQLVDSEAEYTRISALPASRWPLALSRLARLQSAAAAEIILRMLKDENSPEARSTLVRIAGRLRHELTAPALVALLDAQTEPRLLADSIEAAFGVMGGQALEHIRRFIASPHNRVRANAVLAVIRLADDEVVIRSALSALKEMALSENAAFRASAAAMLGELPSACFHTLLQKLLFDGNSGVRTAAVASCVKLRDSAWIKELTALADMYPEQSALALRAVNSLSLNRQGALEKAAAEAGCRERLQDLLVHNRGYEFMDFMDDLFRNMQVEAALKVAEFINSANEQDHQARIRQILTFCDYEFCLTLKAAVAAESGQVPVTLLCLVLAGLEQTKFTRIARLLIADNMFFACRRSLFASLCLRHSLDTDTDELTRRFFDGSKSEKDLVLELFADKVAPDTDNILKSLAESSRA